MSYDDIVNMDGFTFSSRFRLHVDIEYKTHVSYCLSAVPKSVLITLPSLELYRYLIDA